MMSYVNERERRVDRRLADLEREVFGAPQGEDGSVTGRRNPGPTPYRPPRAGTNLASRPRRDTRLNLNRATAEELQTLNGVGRATAERILVHREHEPFESVDDLARVGGIAAKIIEDIRDQVRV